MRRDLDRLALTMTREQGKPIGEAKEEVRGASSTMPQKRNPISCELIIAAARIVRQHAGLMLDTLAHDFERATGPWHLEWAAVSESFALTAGALAQASSMLSGLQVHPGRMRANLDASRGQIVAEAVMMALSPIAGRQAAHDLVYAGCRTADRTGEALLAALSKDDAVATALVVDRLAELTDPANYLGLAGVMVDRILAAAPHSELRARNGEEPASESAGRALYPDHRFTVPRNSP